MHIHAVSQCGPRPAPCPRGAAPGPGSAVRSGAACRCRVPRVCVCGTSSGRHAQTYLTNQSVHRCTPYTYGLNLHDTTHDDDGARRREERQRARPREEMELGWRKRKAPRDRPPRDR